MMASETHEKLVEKLSTAICLYTGQDPNNRGKYGAEALNIITEYELLNKEQPK